MHHAGTRHSIPSGKLNFEQYMTWTTPGLLCGAGRRWLRFALWTGRRFFLHLYLKRHHKCLLFCMHSCSSRDRAHYSPARHWKWTSILAGENWHVDGGSVYRRRALRFGTVNSTFNIASFVSCLRFFLYLLRCSIVVVMAACMAQRRAGRCLCASGGTAETLATLVAFVAAGTVLHWRLCGLLTITSAFTTDCFALRLWRRWTLCGRVRGPARAVSCCFSAALRFICDALYLHARRTSVLFCNLLCLLHLAVRGRLPLALSSPRLLW